MTKYILVNDYPNSPKIGTIYEFAYTMDNGDKMFKCEDKKTELSILIHIPESKLQKYSHLFKKVDLK